MRGQSATPRAPQSCLWGRGRPGKAQWLPQATVSEERPLPALCGQGCMGKVPPALPRPEHKAGEERQTGFPAPTERQAPQGNREGTNRGEGSDTQPGRSPSPPDAPAGVGGAAAGRLGGAGREQGGHLLRSFDPMSSGISCGVVPGASNRETITKKTTVSSRSKGRFYEEELPRTSAGGPIRGQVRRQGRSWHCSWAGRSSQAGAESPGGRRLTPTEQPGAPSVTRGGRREWPPCCSSWKPLPRAAPSCTPGRPVRHSHGAPQPPTPVLTVHITRFLLTLVLALVEGKLSGKEVLFTLVIE